MLKTIRKTLAAILYPKILGKVTQLVRDAWSYVFGSVPEPVVRKKRDTTRLTPEQLKYIIQYREDNAGTQAEHTKILNKDLGVDKSQTSYGVIWRNKENT